MIYSLQNMISSRQSPQKGFVILFAVIITSIVLLVSIGISSVIYKETLLSSSSRDGGYAFFAADSGLECPLYWDSLGIFDSPAIFDDFTKIQATGCFFPKNYENFIFSLNPYYNNDLFLKFNFLFFILQFCVLYC